MPSRPARITPGYAAALAGAFLVAVLAGWTNLAGRMNGDAYDWLSWIHPPGGKAPPASVVLAFDEEALAISRGARDLRQTLARALAQLRTAEPAVVSVDIILADQGDPHEDAALAAAFRKTPRLVLASDFVLGRGVWEDPLPAFRTANAVVGHVHAPDDPVCRQLPLEYVGGRDRRWAIALEAARLRSGGGPVTESPDDLEFAGVHVPAGRETARSMYIRYRTGVPVVSIARVLRGDPAALHACRGKAVFVGVTAQNATRDRLMTPLYQMMSGVEIHAQAFETIVQRDFLRDAPPSAIVALLLGFAVAAGAIFAFLPGWQAYSAAALLLGAGHLLPHISFQNGIVLPYLAPVWGAWLPVVTAASWQHFVVRRQLRQTESDKVRYQQAIHFVTHEMRSPLTAIQGSSELMGRYNLSDDKRKQMAQMINAESKRLAKMIQTFLDIERLTDGQMEIRSEPFDAAEVVRACLERARPLAERKQISLETGEIVSATVRGDRELLEYAVYNLLTNAVKYSPAETTVTVSGSCENGSARISVRDQGIGMDEKEIRKIGTKFYRTKRAEASGEVGTGIGLSLVQQIVAHHHGKIEVASAPGKGSCFTMVLPAATACSQGS